MTTTLGDDYDDIEQGGGGTQHDTDAHDDDGNVEDTASTPSAGEEGKKDDNDVEEEADHIRPLRYLRLFMP